MPFTTPSYVNGYHLSQMMVNGAAYNLDTDSIRVSLYTDGTYSPVMNKDLNELKGSAPYTSNEVSYVGSSVTPGSGAAPATLANPSITLVPGTHGVTPSKIIFDDSLADCSWSNATFTARGAVIWDDTLTSPADPVLCCINFGSDKIVSGGTFTITWDNVNGIFYATY